MTKGPQWMPLFTGDYLCRTGYLTAQEHGALLLLIMQSWQDGGLPADEVLLARYARLSPDEWRASRDVLMDLLDRGIVKVTTEGGRNRSTRPAIPADVRRAVFARDGYKCTYCRKDEGPFDLDHMTPLCRGGPNTIENLTVACAHCNRSKGPLTAAEFMGFDITGHGL